MNATVILGLLIVVIVVLFGMSKLAQTAMT